MLIANIAQVQRHHQPVTKKIKKRARGGSVLTLSSSTHPPALAPNVVHHIPLNSTATNNFQLDPPTMVNPTNVSYGSVYNNQQVQQQVYSGGGGNNANASHMQTVQLPQHPVPLQQSNQQHQQV